MTTSDIERSINHILGITTETLPQPPIKRKRGRRPVEKLKTWSLDFYEPGKNITYALISMCIKDDFEQSLEELATRLSVCKGRPKSECLKVLYELQDCGKLGYYDDYTLSFCTWKGDV